MVTDFLGRPVQRDDIVVYPGRSGAKLWLNKARVLQVDEGKVHVVRDDGRHATVSITNNLIVVGDIHADV